MNGLKISFTGHMWRRDNPAHKCWASMKRRCNAPDHPSYPRYGGRGIKVCKRWSESFIDFLNDVGERPSKKHSLDRIDNDGDYEPGNVRWATPLEQGSNTRKNVYITHNGKVLHKAEWARWCGATPAMFAYRYKQGWDPSRIKEYYAQAK